MTTKPQAAAADFWHRFNKAAEEWRRKAPDVAAEATRNALEIANTGGGCMALQRRDVLEGYPTWRVMLTADEGDLPDLMREPAILGFYRENADGTDDEWSVYFTGRTDWLLQHLTDMKTAARSLYAAKVESEQTITI